MKLTLLELCQRIANKLNSDEINSIGDSVESMQIAMEVRDTYYDMVGNIEMPDQYGLVPLEASNDEDRPTHMKAPERLDNFKFIEYNNGTAEEPDYQACEYLSPYEFLKKTGAYNEGNEAITVQDFGGSYLTIGSNRYPKYYTLFDDEWVVFDSYDADVDDTLQSSKVRAYAQTIPTFSLTDNFYPDLPVKYFPQLLAEATAACFTYFKQTASPTDERRARRQYVRHFNNRTRALNAENSVLDFGRS